MEGIKLKQHIIYESSIDIRHILCACENNECKIGLSVDSYGNNEKPILWLWDKYGNEHGMKLDKKTIKLIIKDLKTLL